jgi:hypothetical protein
MVKVLSFLDSKEILNMKIKKIKWRYSDYIDWPLLKVKYKPGRWRFFLEIDSTCGIDPVQVYHYHKCIVLQALGTSGQAAEYNSDWKAFYSVWTRDD